MTDYYESSQWSEPETETHARQIILTSAATITPRRVRWLWEGRLALGTLGLLAGREGQGKSTITSWLIAAVTRGHLPGEYLGKPRAVIIAATEDSWAHTIVPRLMAADADLSMVYRIDVALDGIFAGSLSFPRDLPELKDSALGVDAALMVLDPLTSRLSESLDTHKDSDTRRALEPLVQLADEIDMAVIGLMHFNKAGKTDPVEAVMASRAFTAVARSVHTVVRDPDDDSRRYFGTPKNNLGPDLPLIGFNIVGHAIETSEGEAWTSRVQWGSEIEGTVSDMLQRSTVPGDRTATQEAADWLSDYLFTQGGRDESAEIKRLGAKAGHTVDSLKRARSRLGLLTESVGFPRRTYWAVNPETSQDPQSEHSRSTVRGDSLTALTTPTGALTDQSVQSVQSVNPPQQMLPLSAVSA